MSRRGVVVRTRAGGVVLVAAALYALGYVVPPGWIYAFLDGFVVVAAVLVAVRFWPVWWPALWTLRPITGSEQLVLGIAFAFTGEALFRFIVTAWRMFELQDQWMSSYVVTVTLLLKAIGATLHLSAPTENGIPASVHWGRVRWSLAVAVLAGVMFVMLGVGEAFVSTPFPDVRRLWGGG